MLCFPIMTVLEVQVSSHHREYFPRDKYWLEALLDVISNLTLCKVDMIIPIFVSEKTEFQEGQSNC